LIGYDVHPPLAKVWDLRDYAVLLSVRLSPVKLFKFIKSFATWPRGGAYRIDSDTLVLSVF